MMQLGMGLHRDVIRLLPILQLLSISGTVKRIWHASPVSGLCMHLYALAAPSQNLA